MLHSPSGFPSRISCRIIGCDFSSLDTFTYCLLKAVSCKYRVANLYCAGDFWAHAISCDCLSTVNINITICTKQFRCYSPRHSTQIINPIYYSYLARVSSLAFLPHKSVQTLHNVSADPYQLPVCRLSC